MELDYDKILKTLEETVRSLWANNHMSNESMSKGEFDIVTETDLAFEKVILDALAKVAPDIPILSEETLSDTEQIGTFFTVDPVDGTWNYANNLSLFGTQIALVEDGELTLGLIYIPALDQMYTAIKGQGSYLNGERFKTVVKDINRAEVALSDLRRGNGKNLQIQLNIAKQLTETFGKTRLLGAACFCHAMIATGTFQGKISPNPHMWDLAPGIALIREAGGVGEFTPECAVCATSQEIFDLMKDIYEKAKASVNED